MVAEFIHIISWRLVSAGALVMLFCTSIVIFWAVLAKMCFINTPLKTTSSYLLLCKRLLYQCNIYSLFCQSFSWLLLFSPILEIIPLSSFGIWLHHFCSYCIPKNVLDTSFSMMFYLHSISHSRMFFVTILTWSIQNTVSVLWKLSFIVLPLFTKLWKITTIYHKT